MEKIKNTLWQVDYDAILALPRSFSRQADRIIWHYENKEEFNVKSCCKLIMSNKRSDSPSDSSLTHSWWSYLWNLNLPN
ncbi:hypothetical protein TorRG33x02_011850 [Trema orientale]|uniref:Uncharacterized protein n=1 Tax=Trema orientale TaxID=63057 RepID=A0A2P5FZA8_TREOI|nr:hypothetical protein TorRG33x02_011850 [Trema orientale]